MALEAMARSSCPKCGFEEPQGVGSCGRCGIVFSKYRPGTPPRLAAGRVSPRPSRWRTLAREWLIESDQANDGATLAGRALVLALLGWWGTTLMTASIESNAAGESFLHLINLPFHEAGHVLFMPFGRFLMLLGGSLGQILMPVVCLLTFVIKTKDPFGAAVALWWTGENFLDLAPYINDARSLDLPLLGGVTGKETDAHDWEQILATLGWLQYDHRLAHLSSSLGTLLMLAAIAWGSLLLFRHFRRLSA
ncbi:MAG TPA: hypothetical protein VFS39_08600 [Nitrospira sp.]|nr:hypothetical protein [Nitrospira sp.]